MQLLAGFELLHLSRNSPQKQFETHAPKDAGDWIREKHGYDVWGEDEIQCGAAIDSERHSSQLVLRLDESQPIMHCRKVNGLRLRCLWQVL